MRSEKKADLFSDIHEEGKRVVRSLVSSSSSESFRLSAGVCQEMEVDNQTNPSQFDTLLVINSATAIYQLGFSLFLLNGSVNIVDFNKKRKLEAEQLGLPISKHQCWNRSLPSKPPTFSSIQEVEGFSPCTFKGKGGAAYDVSETGSAKDSNSFAEDSDCAMSVHDEAKFGTEDTKYLLYGRASSSSSDWGSNSQGSLYSSDSTTVASRSVDKEVLSSPGGQPEPADVELADNLEESLVEYGSHIDYIYSGYGNYPIEEYQDKEIEEILNTNGANPNVYVLSSGRWSANQEAPQTARKPTIDQEFEQYFSTLML
ncbi:Far-red elongated hypocotyl 1, putative isoform 1 [Theobroma cacao]|uniref:Far-red elongated hypocotyl 1, putative isoform 1 n=1 Tax=Theobroma cacao TaxID=3641 RepID=A0A061ES27_THECC|nr:Far-red elongated hypocotyl 1, putative isoform 1 [Theobroma cacao]